MSDPVFLFAIPGYPDYWITEDARVYSTKYRNGKGGARHNGWRMQRPHPRTGHLRIDLRGPDNRKHTIQVQRLMAWTFIGPQICGTLVCHKDGNEHNNDPTNLYYGSVSDNALDRERHKREAGDATDEDWLDDVTEGPAMRDDTNATYTADAELGF